jgi:threonine dehydratase
LAATSSPAVTRDEIVRTYQKIRTHVRRTPVIEVDGVDLGLGRFRLVLKLESLQHAGSFKPRGAFANLLMRPVPKAGVAAASGGNHGAAVAYAPARLGHPASIFVPEISSPAKIARIREFGARLVVGGKDYAEAAAACRAFVEETGALDVHAYDQPETLLGQGTVGLELEAQAANLDSLLVAVGGGGLIGGIAAYLEGRTRIIAIEPETSRALDAALEAGKPVDVAVSGIAADSLGARRVGELMFPIARTFVEEVFTVPDDAIREAQARLWNRLQVVAEPGGATALAALVAGVFRPDDGDRVGVLVCGANTSAVDFGR